MSHCCSNALDISDNYVFGPEFAIHNYLSKLYPNSNTYKVISVCAVVLTASIKVILFPLIVAVGIIALPIIAIARAILKKGDAWDYLKAWGFCLLAGAGCVGFFALFSFHLPLLWSGVLIATAVGVSIIVHVHKILQPSKSLELSN